MTASADLRAIADELARVPRSAMTAAADATKAIATAAGGRYSPMRSAKKRTITLRARDKDLPARAGTARVRVYGTPPGPWVWATDGTAPHAIRRRETGPEKRMTVHHPGSAGRGAWRQVITRALDEVPPIFVDAVREAVRGG